MNSHKKLFSLIIILTLHLYVFAQDDIINEIKKHYYSVAEMISNCEQDDFEKCGLYKNELIINSDGESMAHWPATGNYYRKITFWYDRAPAHWDEDGNTALIKIVIKSIYSVRNYHHEYLFKDGKLIFCFVKEKEVGEYRYYFENEKLIKYLEKTESDYASSEEESDTLIKESKHLQAFFLEMFQ